MALRTLFVDPKLVVRSGIGVLVFLMGIFTLTATAARLPLETAAFAPPPLDIPTPAQPQESIKTLVNWTLSDPITRLIISVGVAYGARLL